MKFRVASEARQVSAAFLFVTHVLTRGCFQIRSGTVGGRLIFNNIPKAVSVKSVAPTQRTGLFISAPL